MINQELLEKINFDKGDGLLPAIVQDVSSGQILMQGFMSKESLEASIKEGKCVFYSRSKERLWLKGESSENYLFIEEILTDCDYDSLLIKARPAGPTCHTGALTCYFNEVYKQ